MDGRAVQRLPTELWVKISGYLPQAKREAEDWRRRPCWIDHVSTGWDFDRFNAGSPSGCLINLSCLNTYFRRMLGPKIRKTLVLRLSDRGFYPRRSPLGNITSRNQDLSTRTAPEPPTGDHVSILIVHVGDKSIFTSADAYNHAMGRLAQAIRQLPNLHSVLLRFRCDGMVRIIPDVVSALATARHLSTLSIRGCSLPNWPGVRLSFDSLEHLEVPIPLPNSNTIAFPALKELRQHVYGRLALAAALLQTGLLQRLTTLWIERFPEDRIVEAFDRLLPATNMADRPLFALERLILRRSTIATLLSVLRVVNAVTAPRLRLFVCENLCDSWHGPLTEDVRDQVRKRLRAVFPSATLVVSELYVLFRNNRRGAGLWVQGPGDSVEGVNSSRY